MVIADIRHKKQPVTVVAAYDVAADAKKRISLRGARTKYFHVQLSNGCFYLEPRVLVSPKSISAVPLFLVGCAACTINRWLVKPHVPPAFSTITLKMLDKSSTNPEKRALVSAPIDLPVRAPPFLLFNIPQITLPPP